MRCSASSASVDRHGAPSRRCRAASSSAASAVRASPPERAARNSSASSSTAGGSSMPRSVVERAAQQRDHVLVAERLELVDPRAREQRRVHLEVRVLGRGAHEPDEALLDRRQQRVLLRLVEAVDLVEEEDRARGRRPGAAPRRARSRSRTSARPAFTADSSSNAALEWCASMRARVVLPGARRPVQDHRVRRALLDRGAQRRPLAQQVLLAHELSRSRAAAAVPRAAGRPRARGSGRPCGSSVSKSLSTPRVSQAFLYSPECRRPRVLETPHHRAAAAADPVQHGQSARQRAGGAGVPARACSSSAGFEVRVAGRHPGAAQPDRAPALGLRRPGALLQRPRGHRAGRPRRLVQLDPWSGELRDGCVWGRGRARHEEPGCGRGGRRLRARATRAGGPSRASC